EHNAHCRSTSRPAARHEPEHPASTSISEIIINVKKTGLAAFRTMRNSTRKATKTKVDRRWSRMEALDVRVDFRISTKKKTRPIRLIRFPSDIEKMPPDIILTDRIVMAQGSPSTPGPNRPASPRLKSRKGTIRSGILASIGPLRF